MARKSVQETPPVPARHEVDYDGRPQQTSQLMDGDTSGDARLREWVGVGGIGLADRDPGPEAF